MKNKVFNIGTSNDNNEIENFINQTFFQHYFQDINEEMNNEEIEKKEKQIIICKKVRSEKQTELENESFRGKNCVPIL